MNDRSSTTKYFMLQQLSRRVMSGYEMMQQLEKITGKKPSTSQIYPVLRQMKSLGYVEVKAKASGKKKIKYYRMLPSGRKFFDSMSRRFEAILMASLSARIKTCAHCGCEIIKGAHKKSGMYFCCVSCAGSYKMI